jgi:phosphoribosylamine---glycine ligase
VKILVIGGGGREHALVWKLKQSPRVEKTWCAPGNGGIAADADCVAVDAGDLPGLVALAERLAPDLTVIGPELPLVLGIGNAFRQRRLPMIGPSRQAARLEGSKIFAKEFLLRHKIPTARMYGAYDSVQAGQAALKSIDGPVVVKADGLCAGKGVLLAPDRAAASDFMERSIQRGDFGAGGHRILLEEALDGEELSFIIVTDGARYAPVVPTRDHKRAFDGNQGPNTGGMGAYSGDDVLTASLSDAILRDVVEPTIQGLGSDHIEYQGFLYFGLMLTSAGPKVLEFNCRLGDPETQAIVPRMDFDLAEVLGDVAAARLDPAKLRWKPGGSVCVVLASQGYPGQISVGKTIEGLRDVRDDSDVTVFHAGTRLKDGSLVSSGGRVLGVTAAKPSLHQAVTAAYQAVAKVHFEGMHYRKDIAAQPSRVHAIGD